jgi:hypothetical protein
MKDLKNNQIPSEIRKKYPKDLSIALDDQREYDYVPPPPPKYIPFSGEGVSMTDERQ